MSRLLASIEEAIRGAKTPLAGAIARTRHGIYMARHGAFDRAKADAELLRSPGPPQIYGFGVAAANLIEAIVAIYLADEDGAVDKLRRAEALAGGRQAGWLYRLVIAWQIHAKVHLIQPEGVSEKVLEVFASIEPSEHDIYSRVCSVVAVAFHWADQYDLARPWYEAARQHAVAEGDELTIDANLHNVASFRVHNIRLQQVTSQPDRDQVERALFEFNSSVNFDRLKRGTTIRWSLPLLSSRVLMLQGDFAGALAQLAAWIEAADATTPAVHQVMAQIDRSLCLAKLGDLDPAVAAIKDALAALPSRITDDELAIAYFAASEIFSAADQGEVAGVYLERSLDRLRRVQHMQQIFLRSVTGLQAP